jgi:hypothetical protein
MSLIAFYARQTGVSACFYEIFGVVNLVKIPSAGLSCHGAQNWGLMTTRGALLTVSNEVIRPQFFLILLPRLFNPESAGLAFQTNWRRGGWVM